MLRIDQMTDLPILNAEAVGALRPDALVAYIDLVGFRDRVNSPFGHVVGDAVLVTVARRLTEAMAPWRVFRSGGDEFTIEIASRLDRAGAEDLSERINDLLASPFTETGEGVEASVGISLAPVGDDPMRAWAKAMYGAHVESRRAGIRLWVYDDMGSAAW